MWGDKLLLKRFLEQCSRTGSQETKDGYRRELRHFISWRDQNHPHLHLRELDPALVDVWISSLREQVEAGELKPRSFNRRISAVSAFYRWAAEPTRSTVTGVPRNPVPRRTGMTAATLAKPLSEVDLTSVLGVISAAKDKGSAIAARDYVMVRGSYLIGCRVSELRLLRWQDLQRLEGGGQMKLVGKGSKEPRTIRVSTATIDLFETLGRGEPEDWLFPSDRRDAPITRQAIGARMAKWGKVVGVQIDPQRCRYTHATHSVRRGTTLFDLQTTHCYSSSATIGHSVAANPEDSSSLRLG
ncbi:tyrosine-type recombinase/integrase [Synechococcus sp. BMK-MC-1]|uniref:tyrosine-type recombinase/integrase n=1 Tax=Synechococcus sp. BMK-MC-1 TaxID=1442551 RepID=UPI002105102F|nr:tyrosine-type recombinase/integrase [Synechococcus sp. BMK-MC-1]